MKTKSSPASPLTLPPNSATANSTSTASKFTTSTKKKTSKSPNPLQWFPNSTTCTRQMWRGKKIFPKPLPNWNSDKSNCWDCNMIRGLLKLRRSSILTKILLNFSTPTKNTSKGKKNSKNYKKNITIWRSCQSPKWWRRMNSSEKPLINLSAKIKILRPITSSRIKFTSSSNKDFDSEK